MAKAARAGLLAALVLVSACSDGDGDDGSPASPTTVDLSAGPASSTGTLKLGDTTYELAVNCYTSSAGMRAVGIGTGSKPEERFEVYVQTDPDTPYLGIRLADRTLVEPALDETLDFYVQDGIIRASAIRLARDLDLETGQGVSMGFGDVEIRCSSYGEAPDPNR